MHCSDVRELLSAYYDDELSSEKRVTVAEHLESCDECSRELAVFERLSSLAGGLETPSPPSQLWMQLDRRLDEEEAGTVQPAAHERSWPLSLPRRVALAAAILLAVGLSWFGYSMWFGHRTNDGFSEAFGQYFEELRRDPEAAQQLLLVKYDGQAVDAQQAVHQVGYRPAVADGLPEGYAVESTYVMNMPCCKCVQCLCKRSDGTTVTIFEHNDDGMKQWFGDRPQVSTTCNGKPCSLVELNDRLAASWQQDNRHITVIGVRDIAELTQLVAWFDERKRIRPPQPTE